MTGVLQRLLVFTIQNQSFALPLEQIAEVLDPPPIFPIPRGPVFFLGVINFHGQVVPVLDLADYLKLGRFPAGGKFLVLDGRIANLALAVEPAVDLISSSTVLEEEAGDHPLVDRILVTADREVSLLNPDLLLRELEEHLNG